MSGRRDRKCKVACGGKDASVSGSGSRDEKKVLRGSL